MRVEGVVTAANLLTAIVGEHMEQQTETATGIAVADPYTDPRAAVFHQAPFDTLRQAVHGADQNRSLYHPPDDEQLAQLTGCMTPFLLNDAAFKVAQLMVLPDGSMPVCVIAELASVYFAPG